MSTRTAGVIGTMVWDRIVGRTEGPEPVEEWGGVAYTVAAMAASLPEGWSVLPIVKIGSDLANVARNFLDEIPRVRLGALVEVAEPNNRVELCYQTDARRVERLTGGVPSWTWNELAPRVGQCDALYVNFVSGAEMGVDTAALLDEHFEGPTYADLHSLFLGIDERGVRVPRALEEWATWLDCFDAVQMNEDEFELLGEGESAWPRVANALERGLRLVTVTKGELGAECWTGRGFDDDGGGWPRYGSATGVGRACVERVALAAEPRVGDPTGCGDVWGAATFARLLAGDTIEVAMSWGNRLGGLNVDHRGARGLYRRFSPHPRHDERDVAT